MVYSEAVCDVKTAIEPFLSLPIPVLGPQRTVIAGLAIPSESREHWFDWKLVNICFINDVWYMKWIIYELRIWNQVKLWSSKLWTQFLQLRREAWKNQDFNGVWTRDLAIPVRRSNQLSYEATDVGSWSSWSRVQTPLKSWIFQASLRNCKNCVHNCEDHSFTWYALFFSTITCQKRWDFSLEKYTSLCPLMYKIGNQIFSFRSLVVIALAKSFIQQNVLMKLEVKSTIQCKMYSGLIGIQSINKLKVGWELNSKACLKRKEK